MAWLYIYYLYLRTLSRLTYCLMLWFSSLNIYYTGRTSDMVQLFTKITNGLTLRPTWWEVAQMFMFKRKRKWFGIGKGR